MRRAWAVVAAVALVAGCGGGGPVANPLDGYLEECGIPRSALVTEAEDAGDHPGTVTFFIGDRPDVPADDWMCFYEKVDPDAATYGEMHAWVSALGDDADVWESFVGDYRISALYAPQPLDAIMFGASYLPLVPEETKANWNVP